MTTRNRALTLLSTLLAPMILGGCSWGFGPGKAEAPEMHRQFSQTVDIQTGVILGDLDQARSAAGRIAAHQAESPTSATGRYQVEIREYAALASQTEDPDTVSGLLGRMAVRCGECHQATSGGPRFVLSGGPAQGSPSAQHMITHLWAVDRMWEGLIGPSEESWKAGAEALLASWENGPMALPAFSGESLAEPTPQMRQLAREATAADALEDRAATYGRVLATCNRCHGSMGSLVAR